MSEGLRGRSLNPRTRAIFASLATYVSFAAVGVAAGLAWYHVLAYYVPTGQWERIDLGGERAARVVSVGQDPCRGGTTFYLQLASGGCLACYDGTCEPVEAWRAFAPKEQEGDELKYTAPRPPGKVLSISSVSRSCFGEHRYAVLEDGSAWRWQVSRCCELDCLTILMWQGLFSALGIVAGMLAARHLLKRRSGSSEGASPDGVATRSA